MTPILEPFAPLFQLSREIEGAIPSSPDALRPFLPPADVFVTADHVTVVMDVPGFKPSGIDVELGDSVLTVRGERELPYPDTAENGPQWRRLERGFGKFERVLQLPEGLDPDAIDASLSDGVLTLRLPMPQARRPRRIEITGGEGRRAIEPMSPDSPTEEREPAGAAA
jgi:HSP20 family protein